MAVEYELLYLVGEKNESELPTIRTSVEDIITKEGGSFLPAETSDKRRLAYPIKKETRGTYIARRFTLPDRDEKEPKEGDAHPLLAINHALKLHPTVLRFLIVRADELPELKQIEREEKKDTLDRKLGRGERRKSIVVTKDVPKVAEAPKETKEVSKEQIDEQLKTLGIE